MINIRDLREPAGLGILFEVAPDGALQIKKLEEGGSAYASGSLSPGDTLLEIDGMDVFRRSRENVGRLVVGERGTSVRLKLLRGTTGPYEVDLVRGISTLSSPSKTPVSPSLYGQQAAPQTWAPGTTANMSPQSEQAPPAQNAAFNPAALESAGWLGPESVTRLRNEEAQLQLQIEQLRREHDDSLRSIALQHTRDQTAALTELQRLRDIVLQQSSSIKELHSQLKQAIASSSDRRLSQHGLSRDVVSIQPVRTHVAPSSEIVQGVPQEQHQARRLPLLPHGIQETFM